MPDPSPPATIPPGRRKRFGLSLRVLMVLVLLLGGGLGWVAYRARVQREAVAAIEAAGGKVYYDFEWKYQDNGPVLRFYSFLTPRKHRWPKWLVDRVGPDYLGSVIGVQFLHGVSHEADDSLLAHIGRLSVLEDLDFRGFGIGYTGQSRLTDAGLAQLRELTRLRRLRLGASKIKGAGLLHLSGLRGLKNLDLEHIQIADGDAKALSSLTMLEGLLIESDELTDAGMVHLAPLKQLKCLDLRAKKVTATGLNLLQGWSQLEHLSLWQSGINDDSFLREFPRLISLNLSIQGPMITSLGSLSNLRELSLTCFPYSESLLEQIGRLQGLTELRLGLVGYIPKEDFLHLSRLTHLESLSMMGSPVTDSALSNLAELNRLKSLSLANTSIGDAGLRYLSGLIELETLQLDHTKITDAGLMHLVPLKKCKKLTIAGTRVSVDGFSTFRAKQEESP